MYDSIFPPAEPVSEQRETPNHEYWPGPLNLKEQPSRLLTQAFVWRSLYHVTDIGGAGRIGKD